MTDEGTRVALPPAPAPAPSESTHTPAPAPDSAAPDAAAPDAAPAPDAASDAADNPEEDLLRDVLDELDKERTKRAEVEADVRQLSEQVQSLQQQLAAQKRQQKQQQEQEKPKESEIISRHAFVAMEAQVAGFKQLVDAVTMGKPAIAAAAKQQQQQKQHPQSRGGGGGGGAARPPKTLPLHVVRLLEVLPWDPRAAEHVFGTEVLYEWQVYDSARDGGRWHSHVRQFPPRLKNLPLYKAESSSSAQGSSAADGLLHFLAGEKAITAAQPSKHGVLTDANLQHVIKIEAGYPLPSDGGRWEWVGGWRIEKRVKNPTVNPTATEYKQTVDCDADGWSYATSVQDFEDLPTELVWDNPGDIAVERRIRRRKWIRQRVLVDYPYASERTQQYLKLLAENARLTVTTNKISDQLVETKTKLTEAEQTIMELQSTSSPNKQAPITRETSQQPPNQRVVEIGKGTTAVPMSGGGGSTASLGSASSSQHGKRIKEFLQKNDQVKEFGSKISSWVNSAAARKTSEDFNNESGVVTFEDSTMTHAGLEGHKSEFSSTASIGSAGSGPGGGESSSHNNNASGGGTNNPFNWRKVGRGALIEKLAGKKPPQSYDRTGSLKMDEETITDVTHEGEERDGGSNENTNGK